VPFWSERVVPRITDLALGTPDVRALRERVLACPPRPAPPAGSTASTGSSSACSPACHLTRPIDDLVRTAGLTITDLTHDRLRGPGPMSYLYLGTATP
jgi:hypothetical protein